MKILNKLLLILCLSGASIFAMDQKIVKSSRKRKLDDTEQEIKTKKEVTHRKLREKDKLTQINDFYKTTLNKHLIGVLSDLVLGYVDINSSLNRNSDYRCSYSLNENTMKVKNVIQLQNRYLAAYGTYKKAIEIWKLIEDKYSHVQTLLDGEYVDGLIELQDGSLISFSDDDVRIKKWIFKDGIFCFSQVLFCDRGIRGITQLKDGSLAVCSTDKTIKIWSLTKYNIYSCTQILKGHTDFVNGVIQLEDGSLASYSYDKTIKIWAIEDDNYVCKQTLDEHSYGVRKVIQLRNSSLASCSNDGTIKIWKQDKDSKYFCFYSIDVDESKPPVHGFIELQDGSLVSWSDDKKVRRWCFKEDKYFCSQILPEEANCLIQLQDGSLVSCSSDDKINFWQNEISKIVIPIIEND